MATEALDSKRAQFLALAGTAFEQLFGTDGQNGLVTFTEREERACTLTDELARWLMAEHVAQGNGTVSGPFSEGNPRPSRVNPCWKRSAEVTSGQCRAAIGVRVWINGGSR